MRGWDIFHKEQTKYRLEGGAQGLSLRGREGCHHSHFVSPTGNQPEQVATLSSPGTDWCVCLARGSFAVLTLLSLFGSDCLFWAAVLECLRTVSTQATVSS